MLKPTLGLLGIGALLLGIVLAFVSSDSSQTKVTSLNDETMVQLIGGDEYTQGDEYGENSDKCLYCPGRSHEECSEILWVKRTYHSCPVCYSGQSVYIRDTDYWYEYGYPQSQDQKSAKIRWIIDHLNL